MQSEFEKTFKQHIDGLTAELSKLGKQRQVQVAEWDIEQNKADYEFYFNAGWEAAKAQAVPEGFTVVPTEITPKQIEAYMKGRVFPASMSEHRKFVERLSKDYKAMIEVQENKE